MAETTFAIVGTGWRSEFYLRVARALPERFRVTGVLTRKPDRTDLEGAWSVPARATIEALLADHPSFAVLSVPWAVTPVLIRELAERGLPVLAETPPAPDLEGLEALGDLARDNARVQVAEQYQFQPAIAARLALVRSGRLGRLSEAHLSLAHGYHGIDLLRRFLGVGLDPVTVTARRFVAPIVAGPDRSGPPAEERLADSVQTIAWFDWGDRLGIHDFCDEQYFSWIRGRRCLLRGERGEIDGATVRLLLDAWTPVEIELVRRDAGRDGNLEGLHQVGITAGETWLYRNPFAPARLSEDEIAVAECLERMAEYVGGGPGFCSLAEGAHDHYLGLMAARAADEGRPLRAPGLGWARPAADGGAVGDRPR
ncbi:MAG: Gfo/Idh/MocA family protein [Candidatus Limnocylindrales bacterium]